MGATESFRGTLARLDRGRRWRVPAAVLAATLATFGLVHGALVIRRLSGFLRTGTLGVDVVVHMTAQTPVRAPLFSVIVLAGAGLTAARTRSLPASYLVAFGMVFGASWALFDSPLGMLLSGDRFLVEVAWYAGTLAVLLGVGGFLLGRGWRLARTRIAGR